MAPQYSRRTFLKGAGLVGLSLGMVSLSPEGESLAASESPIVSARLISERFLFTVPGTQRKVITVSERSIKEANVNNPVGAGVSLLGELDDLASSFVHQQTAEYIDKLGVTVGFALMAIPQIEFRRAHVTTTEFNPGTGIVTMFDRRTGLPKEYVPIYFNPSETGGRHPVIVSGLMGNLSVAFVTDQLVIEEVRQFPWQPIPKEATGGVALAVNENQQRLINTPYDGHLYGYNDRMEIVYRSEQPSINLPHL